MPNTDADAAKLARLAEEFDRLDGVRLLLKQGDRNGALTLTDVYGTPAEFTQTEVPFIALPALKHAGDGLYRLIGLWGTRSVIDKLRELAADAARVGVVSREIAQRLGDWTHPSADAGWWHLIFECAWSQDILRAARIRQAQPIVAAKQGVDIFGSEIRDAAFASAKLLDHLTATTSTEGSDAIPDDPIPVTWLRKQVPTSKVKGDASKLAGWLKKRNIRIYKVAGRNHAKRDDLLRIFRSSSRLHDLIAGYGQGDA